MGLIYIRVLSFLLFSCIIFLYYFLVLFSCIIFLDYSHSKDETPAAPPPKAISHSEPSALG